LVGRLGIVVGVAGGANVEDRDDDAIALVGDGIARHGAQHGERRHAGGDADREGDHHERGEHRVAPELAHAEGEVVAEHGGPQVAAAREAGIDVARSAGSWTRSETWPSMMWTLRWARAASSGS